MVEHIEITVRAMYLIFMTTGPSRRDPDLNNLIADTLGDFFRNGLEWRGKIAALNPAIADEWVSPGESVTSNIPPSSDQPPVRLFTQRPPHGGSILVEHIVAAGNLIWAFEQSNTEEQRLLIDELVANGDRVSDMWQRLAPGTEAEVSRLWLAHITCTGKYISLTAARHDADAKEEIKKCKALGAELGQYLDRMTNQ